MPVTLFTTAFFEQLRDLMSPGGIMAVNYFGREDDNLAAVLCALRSAGFRHVRVFAEQMHGVESGVPQCMPTIWKFCKTCTHL